MPRKSASANEAPTAAAAPRLIQYAPTTTSPPIRVQDVKPSTASPLQPGPVLAEKD